VKIGIAGLGFMGATHVAAIQKIPGLELAAVCTTNERALSGDLTEVGGNLDLAPAKYDFSALHKCREWRDLVADAELDAVDICLPTDLHTEVAIAALERGKHVLCEKPMALNRADCDRMIAAAKSAGRVLMIGQVLRFWPEYEVLRDAVREKRYGAVRQVEFRRSAGLPDWSRWLPQEARSGGAVVDLLVHDIDQAVALFGMPKTVSAKSLGAEDTIDAALDYGEGGPPVRIKGGWLPVGTPFSMGFRLEAERGTLELGGDGLFLEDEAGRRAMEAPKGDGYRNELAYFAECCSRGLRPERCPPEESAAGIALALLLKDSRAKEGQTIQCSD
jgi:predicted dehydrogenase